MRSVSWVTTVPGSYTPVYRFTNLAGAATATTGFSTSASRAVSSAQNWNQRPHRMLVTPQEDAGRRDVTRLAHGPCTTPTTPPKSGRKICSKRSSRCARMFPRWNFGRAPSRDSQLRSPTTSRAIGPIHTWHFGEPTCRPSHDIAGPDAENPFDRNRSRNQDAMPCGSPARRSADHAARGGTAHPHRRTRHSARKKTPPFAGRGFANDAAREGGWGTVRSAW
jgi:hypothetical protein